jgi:aryl-alcohol dehydrogenase-like predicted oxidoreductase
MHYRTLGKTGWKISELSLGTWQVGGRWGEPFDEAKASRILHRAIDLGINFIDTADVYGDGGRESERMVGQVIREREEQVYLATKIGRRLDPHLPEGYNRDNLTRFVDEALTNTGMERLDLVQLHCPPSSVYARDEVFALLDEFKQAGKIRHYGVSVEQVSEALQAIEYPGLATVQIIFNLMRLKPAEDFFPHAQAKRVGVIARVPLASGLLTGKFSAQSTFAPGDHRHFNREGEAFDKGETFSGVPYQLGLRTVKEYIRLFGTKYLTQHALRWVLMFEAISCVIPGASSVEQLEANVQASDLAPLPPMAMDDAKAVYDQLLRQEIHAQW